MILIQEAIKTMKSRDHLNRPAPFNIAFVTCDLTRKTGGEIIELENVIATSFPDDWAQIKLTNEQRRKVHVSLILKINNQQITWDKYGE